jgi:microcystin-dependent protein
MHFTKSRRGSLSLWAVIAIWTALIGADRVSGQSVPPLINYQGQIQNPNGTLPPTADYTLTFRIYNAAQGGVLVWGQQVYDGTGGLGRGGKVPLVQGFFNVLLGPVDTTGRQLQTAFTNSIRYLEMQLGTNPPIAPRQQLLSAPFALRAGGSDFADNAGKLGGFDWSHLLSTNDPVNGKIAGDKIADGTIATSQLGDGVVTTSKLALQAVTTDRIASNSITEAQLASGAVGSNQLKNGQITRAKLDPQLALDAIIPPGTILPYGGNTATVPEGWMYCDGRTVSRTNFNRLYAAILTTWGPGDSINTFHIPDLRGMFLRGAGNHGVRDMASGSDFSGGTVGAYQQDSFQGHRHTFNVRVAGGETGGGAVTSGSLNSTQDFQEYFTTSADAIASLDAFGTPRVGTETKPASYSVNYIIKY